VSDSRTVAVKLQADVNGYRTSMKQAAQSTDQLDKAQAKAQKNSEKWKAVGVASQVAGAAVAAGLVYATKAASEQEQAVGALTATFKVNGAAMKANADKASDLGLSITDYSNAAAKLGGQLSNLGVDQKDLGAITDDLVRKASDLAAQYGGSTSEAVDALGAAMRGEADPAERYSLALNQTAVNAEMLATGGDKAQAILSLINEQMAKSGAAGAMSREYDTAAASMARAQAEFDNATAALGEGLLPVMAGAAKAASRLLGVFNDLPDPLKNALTIIAAVGGAGLLAGPSLMKMVNALGGMKNKLLAVADPLSATNVAMSRTSKIAAVGAGALGAATLAFGVYANAQANAKAKAEELGSTLDETTNAATELTRQKLGEEFLANFDASELEQTPFTLQQIVDAVAEGGPAFDELRGQVQAYVDESKTGLQGLNSVHNDQAQALLNSVDAANRDASAARQLAGAQDQAATAAKGSADASYADAEAKENQAAALKKATEQYDAYLAAVDKALSLMSARDALIGQDERLAEAAKKNGNALRGYTAAAGANREAIGQEVSNIKDLIRAKYDETGSLKAANRVRSQHIDNLREAAAAAEYDASETQHLLKKLGLLKPIRTTVKVDGVSAAANEAERLLAAMRRVTGVSGTPGFGAFFGGHATGGYISGPGTGTSDSIPAMLSDGEYVMTAKATKRLGVDRLNAMNYARGGLVGYARGGSVNGAGQANLAVGAGKALRQVEKWREAVKAARENVRDLRKQAKEYATTVASNVLSAGGPGLFESFTRSGIVDSWKNLAAAQDGVADASRRVYDAQVKVNTASPEGRAAALAELADAQRDLADAQGEQTAAEAAAAKAAPTADGILGRMRERARLVVEYGTKVKSLLSKGLSMALIKDLAGADPIEAGPVLDALLKMNGKQLKELGALDSQARSAAASVGKAVSKKVNKKDMKAANIELRATTKQLDKDIRAADRTIDKDWRKKLAKAGLGAEERVELLQSIRDNDGKLTAHWRNVLAKAGLGAEERGDLLAVINGADTVLTDHWRNKLAVAGLSAEDRGELMQSLIDNDGKLTREWRDKLAAAGLSAAERNNLITNGIRDADTKARVDWTNNDYRAGLGAERRGLAETVADERNKGAAGWRDDKYRAGLDAERRGLAESVQGERRDKAAGWGDFKAKAGLDAERRGLAETVADEKRKGGAGWQGTPFNAALSANANKTGLNAGVAAAKAIIRKGFTGFTISIGGSAGSAVGRNVRRASGGLVRGAGTGTSDSIPVRLSNGEYVIRASSVKRYGADLMDAINMGRFASGGPVGFRTISSPPAGGANGLTLTTSTIPVVVQLDNRTLATGQLKLRRQSGGTVTLGG